MSRNQDKTGCGESIADVRDKNSDYRMFSERGNGDRAYLTFEGDRIQSELDNDDLLDSKTDLHKLNWHTDTQRGLIDDRWW